MDKIELSQPIQALLNDSNYNIWAQSMHSFLIGCKLWHILTRHVTKPMQEDRELEVKFMTNF